jgi:hypothetical protein
VKYEAKKTRHKWIDVWKYKSHYIMKEEGGLYHEITNPSNGSYMRIGKGHKDIDECIKHAIAGKEKFFRDYVTIV